MELNGSEIIQELAQSGAEAPGPPYRQSWEDFGSASRHPAVISGSGRRRRLASSGGGAPGAANRKSVASSGAGDRHSALLTYINLLVLLRLLIFAALLHFDRSLNSSKIGKLLLLLLGVMFCEDCVSTDLAFTTGVLLTLTDLSLYDSMVFAI